MRTIGQLLGEAPLFAGLGDEYLALIAGCGQNVRLATDQRLFREGEPANTFYVVRHGAVALEIAMPARTPVVIETLHDGDVVGWSWLVPPYRWHFDARAVEPTAAVAMDGACLRGKCEDDPALGFELMQRFAQVMVERLQATRMRLLDLYGAPRAG
jgi:CRP-like cAMP-binding protein